MAQNAGTSSTGSPRDSHASRSPSQLVASATPASAQAAAQTTAQWLAQPPVASFIAGGVAGAVSRTVVSPLERVKILLQVQNAGRNEYPTVGKALSKMWREEGWRGFMRGNGVNCVRIVPYSAVQFGSYNLYKQYLEPYPGAEIAKSPLRSLTCGALAGMTSVIFTYPLDIVRTRLAIQTASISGIELAAGVKPPGIWRTTVNVYRTEGGLRALYGGVIPTLVGVAPYVGLNFMFYELARKFVTPEGEKNPGTIGKLGAGAVSGAIAQTCTYPFDVLRRRFQVNTMNGMGYQYTSMWDACKVIVAQEGFKGFYKGIVPNLLKVAPSMASSWLSFEICRDLLMDLGKVSS